MGNSHDQSYYEIALTNRQVMSIFVVLLVCILAAFLGGVWLGRDADAAVEMASAQSISAAQAEGTAIEELDFFTRRDDAAKASAPAEASAMASAKTSEGPERVPAQPERAPSTGESRTEPAGGGRPREPGVEKDSPASTQAPASGAAVRRESAPAGSEAGAAASVPDSVVIQVFSSNEEAQARRVVDQLRQSGYPAILSPVEVAGRTLHRVRIGPYTDPDEAQVVAESVRRAFKFDTWITH